MRETNAIMPRTRSTGKSPNAVADERGESAMGRTKGVLTREAPLTSACSHLGFRR